MITPPKMMTIREIAKTGLLPEHALRMMLKAGKLPVIYVGCKALINFDKLCEQLSTLGESHARMPDRRVNHQRRDGSHGIQELQ